VLARLIAAVRSPAGRLVAGALGLAGVALIVRGIGLGVVADSLAGAVRLFPAVVALEGVRLACTVLALRALYDRPVPIAPLARAGLIGYAVMGLVPAGRAVAEVARATMLARYVGATRAAVAAVRIQGASLVANALISLLAAAAVWLSLRAGAPAWLSLAILGNAAVTLVPGIVLLSVSARTRLGAWVARLSRRRPFGAGVAEALEEGPRGALSAVGWEFLGRVLEVAQYAILLACVGGAPTPRLAFTAEGIHLVGAAVGDLLPAHLGTTEGNFTLAASALALPVASAVSIALLAHLAQLLWVLAGSGASLFWSAPTPDPMAAPHPQAVKVAEGDPVP